MKIITRKQNLKHFPEWQFYSFFYVLGIKEATKGKLHEGGRKKAMIALQGS